MAVGPGTCIGSVVFDGNGSGRRKETNKVYPIRVLGVT